MTAELGLLCLIIACALALLQIIPSPTGGGLGWGRSKRDLANNAPHLTSPLRGEEILPLAQCALVFVALLLLIACRIHDDFTVANVAEHSNRTLPLLYKIVGAWGNHEGSMVLVVLVLSAYALALAHFQPQARLARSVQGALSAAFLLFILLTSNPFARIFPPPEDGQALNPLLQDIALAMHPPLLYLGYMGFSVPFALAVAALFAGKLDRAWAARTHRWILVAWSFLTVGITLGSWWAYRVLGWGGYWFWDPVENASLLPWLAGTALLHANLALRKRGTLAHWVLLLAILTFAMSLLGTFLVRSGAVTSVHSFASDPTRGIWMLGYFALFIGGALALYAWRGGRISSENVALPASREGLIVLNGMALVIALAIVLLGTVYPMLSDWLWDRPLAVGAPYFERTALPVLACALLLAAIGPLAAWRQDKSRRIIGALAAPATAALAAACIMLAFSSRGAATAAAGFALAAWLIGGTYVYARRPGAKPATVVAHLGAAVLALGVTGMAAWQVQSERGVQGVATSRHGNYIGQQARVEVEGAVLKPQRRIYDIAQTATTEPAIAHRWWGDIVAVVAAAPEGEGVRLRIYLNPLVYLIWLGGLMMASGGAIAAWKRKGKR